MRFLHVADVHLDTLFASRSGPLRDLLREASREAFRRAVRAAVARQVDVFLISGDLFDGERLSFETERFLLEELGRLGTAGIPAVYATGNHDPGRGASRAGELAWPANVTVVRDGTPVRVTVEDADGMPRGTITAAGHVSSAVSDDLSRAFPAPRGPHPSVALLHTQVSDARASTEHERYAPSELQYLREAGFDYWALGHVHLRQALSETPGIHYPGNLQGRNPGESGAKGCLFVDLADRHAPQVEFLDLAPVRWETLRVGGLDAAGQLHLLVRRIASAWREARAEDPGSAGTEWLVRVELVGPCPLWRELSQEEDRETLQEQLAASLDVLRAEVRAEGVHPVHAAEEHLERQDVLGEALRLLRSARECARGEASAAALLGIDPDDLGGFDPARHGSLDAYFAELLEGQEGELLARVLASGSVPEVRPLDSPDPEPAP